MRRYAPDRPIARRMMPIWPARRWAAAVVAAATVSSGVLLGGAANADPAPTPSASPTVSAGPTPDHRNYYVDCSKNVSGDATTGAHAWNSLAAVNRHGAFKPGDRILLRRGTTCTGRVHPSGSGTRKKPILLGAYGSGVRPTINGGGTPNGTATVQLVDVHDWTVQDLHLTNAGSNRSPLTNRSGLLFYNTGVGRLAGLTAQRLRIEKVWSNPGKGSTRAWGGIAALTFGAGRDGFTGMRIQQNQIDHVGRTGIVVYNGESPRSWDTDVRVTGNSVRWVRGDSIIAIGVKGGRIDHNVSAHGADLGACSVKQCGRMGGPTTASAGIWPAFSRNLRIDHNEIYGEHAASGDGEGIDVDQSAQDIVVEHNYAHDNEGGGIMFCGARYVTVRFNILQNNSKTAFTFTCRNKVKDIRIYNNDVYQAASVYAPNVVRTIHGFGGGKIQFLNNLVYTWNDARYAWPSRPRSAGNTFVGTWSATEPTGTQNSHTDPGLRHAGTGGIGLSTLGGYRFRNPGRAPHGVAVPSSVRTDFFGKLVRPKAPLRGAAAR